MTIKWSRLPYLVKKEILDHLDMNQVFFLLLCSKNIKNFIIHTQKYQFGKIERVRYNLKGRMFISMKMMSSKVRVDFMGLLPNERYKFINGPVEKVRVNVLGTPIDFYRSLHISSNLHAKYTASTIGIIHNYLYELLGHCTEFRLFCDIRKALVPLIPNIHTFQVTGGDHRLSIRDKTFLPRLPCLEYLGWDASHPENVMCEENSTVYKVDTVEVMGENALAADVLKHFNGRNAFLWCRGIGNNHVANFMKAWESGEKFRNLEYICIISRHLGPEISRTIRLKRVNKRAVFIPKMKDNAHDFYFESHWYMVRRSDRCVASVLLKPGRVRVGVWNMTEDKFLEKFQ